MPAAVWHLLRQVFALSNYILKYARDERVKYISHLDFVRLFHRAVRRTDLQFMFSHGFNPHPIMTVALPLSVGVTADGEYMKIGLDGEYTENYILTVLNGCLPPGYKILAVKRLEGKELDLTKIDRAVYTVELESDSCPNLESFMSNKELIVPKKSKSGIKDSDIRPYIYNIENIGRDSNSVILKMTLSAGSVYNLKPETVAEALKKYTGFEYGFIKCHRNSLLCGDIDYLQNSVSPDC